MEKKWSVDLTINELITEDSGAITDPCNIRLEQESSYKNLYTEKQGLVDLDDFTFEDIEIPKITENDRYFLDNTFFGCF